MLNNIVNAISKTLKTQFPNAKIYTEIVAQGFIEPCFYVAHIKSKRKQLLNTRAILNNSFDVHYFPTPNGNKNEELQTIAENLYCIFGRINMLNGDKLNGFNLEHEIQEEVLHFFVDFKPVISCRDADEETMNDLEALINAEE